MFKKFTSIVLAVLLIISLASCKGAENIDYLTDYKAPSGGYKQLNPPEEGEEIAVITTNLGVIKVRLFPEYAPKAVENFITHSKNGYYDGLTFHRIIEGFVIQGGDPLGTGGGGESIWGSPFAVEPTPQLHHLRGALAMAKSSLPVSIGSQFYFVQNNKLDDSLMSELEYMRQNLTEPFYVGEKGEAAKDEDGNVITIEMRFQKEFIDSYIENGGAPQLDYGYTVFGQAFEGLDVIDAIAAIPTSSSEKPLDDAIIESIVIEKY